jgi:hypothetical protein
MLAIVITGLLLATVYGALSRTTSSKEIAEERAELFSNGRQAVLRMASDIEGSLPPPAGDRIFFRGSGGGGSPPTLEFVMMNRGGYGVNRVRAGRVLVAYSLVEVPGRASTFALVRDEFLFSAMLADADGIQPSPPEDGEEPPPVSARSVLLDCVDAGDLNLPGSCMRVTGLSFRYYDELVRDWRDDWDSSQDAALGRLPAAVEIALRVADKDGVEQDFHTIVDLPLARGQPTPDATGGAQTVGGQGGTGSGGSGGTGSGGGSGSRSSGSTGAGGFMGGMVR